MLLEAAVKEFLDAKRQEGLSAATVGKYGWHLLRLTGWLEEQGVTTVEGIERAALRRWGAGIRDVWSPATCRQGVTAARSWLRWCQAEGFIKGNVDCAGALKPPKVPLAMQRTLTGEELRRLLASCDESAKGVRDAALLSLLGDSALRRAEFLSLTPAHLDFERGIVEGVVRKGGQVGWAPFGAATAARLRRWLAVRAPAEGVEALWVSLRGDETQGRPLTGDGLRTIVRKRGEAIGIAGVTPHAFRRGWACAMSEACAPLKVIVEAGGWRHEHQLLRYTQALESQRLAPSLSPVDRLPRGERQLGLWE